MKINLWNRPMNGGCIWFSRENLRRFDWGVKDGYIYWWAIFGFSGRILIQHWPWSRQ